MQQQAGYLAESISRPKELFIPGSCGSSSAFISMLSKLTPGALGAGVGESSCHPAGNF